MAFGTADDLHASCNTRLERKTKTNAPRSSRVAISWKYVSATQLHAMEDVRTME